MESLTLSNSLHLWWSSHNTTACHNALTDKAKLPFSTTFDDFYGSCTIFFFCFVAWMVTALITPYKNGTTDLILLRFAG